MIKQGINSPIFIYLSANTSLRANPANTVPAILFKIEFALLDLLNHSPIFPAKILIKLKTKKAHKININPQ